MSGTLVPARRARAPRLWAYQRERFPLAQHGPFIAVFTASALCVAALASPHRMPPGLVAMAGAFASVVAGFLLMRIADEFKDAATDAQHRPTRPVPRGLVSLRELFGLGLAAAAAQAALVVTCDLRLLPTLLLWWAFFLCTAFEFGARRWLERRPLLYMASHLPSLALLYLHACAWARPEAQLQLSAPVLAALAMAYLAGVVFEIARKVRAPCEEQPGVVTYTAAWGLPRAAGSLVLAMAAAAACAVLSLALLEGESGLVLACGALFAAFLAVGARAARRFVRQPGVAEARALRSLGALFTLLAFLVAGPVALLGVPS